MKTLKLTKYILSLNKEKSFFCLRLCSTLNQSNDAIKINPLTRIKSKFHITVEDDSRIASRICITILGNGGVGQPKCVGLFTEFKGYLFNCGEGVGRYCKEYGINTYLLKHIFITQRKWENISGLADVRISNQAIGVYNMSLYGPPGIEQFESVVMHSKKKDSTLEKKKNPEYIDHTLNIKHIPINAKHKNIFAAKSNFKSSNIKKQSDVVYSYVCEFFERPGNFLVEKCVELGVPVGPELLNLKNGKSVELPCGRTVHSEDVHGPFYPSGMILIVDCPSEDYLESIIEEKKFEAFQLPLNESSNVFAVFHFTPSHIFNSNEYKNWINRFHPNTEHYALNSDCPVAGSKVIHQTQKYLNKLHPKIFSNLRDEETLSNQKILDSNNIIYPPPMMQIYIRPEKKVEWFSVVNKDPSSQNVAVDGTEIVMWTPELEKKIQDLKSALQKKSVSNAKYNKLYPEIVFLGTSSSTSTAYRNVSGILVNVSPNNSILLDCGEGTFMQLARCFGSDLDHLLRKISCIFISHLHTDHYMGVFELVSQRLKACQKVLLPYKPVVLILPIFVKNAFMAFCDIFQDLYPAVRIYSCKGLEMNSEKLRHFVNIGISTVPVVHCTDAHAVILESGSEWKIVYSGDTAPCQKLVDAGKDCTLLIHEASIDDNLIQEATSKMHCTPMQVIDVAEKMNAQYTIMTHFSKRYLPVPVTPECDTREIGYAYDFMRVRMCDLPLLPLFTPAIKSMFKDNLHQNEQKSMTTSSNENVLLRHLKS